MPGGSDTLEILTLSDLLSERQRAEVRRWSEAGHDAAAILERLDREGWLTPYQLEQVRAGNGKGLVLGTRVLLEKIGAGAMGQVFKALHRRLDRIEAVKLIHPDRMERSDAVERFRREARAAARLSHPHVVTIFDADEAQGVHFLAMEFVPGFDLQSWARRRGPLPVGLACFLLRQAALGLAHAHERGLIHRDVKPANMLLADLPDPVTGHPLLKVSDLGLARLLPRTERTDPPTVLTADRSSLGTPDFVAPEQILDAHEVDGRADLYGLGCTLYFLLSGTPPFPGGNVRDKLQGHLYGTPRPLEELRPDLPPGLGDLARRMMERDPDRRFATGKDVAAALAPYADAGGEPPSTGVFPPEGGATPVTLLESSRFRRRSRWPYGAAAVLALGLGAIFLLVLRDPPGAKTNPEEGKGGLSENEKVSIEQVASGLPAGSGRVDFRKHLESVMCADLVPGGVLAGGYPDAVVFRESNHPDRRRIYPHDSVVTSLAVSPDGKWFLSGEYEEKVRWWRLDEKTPRFLMTGHQGYVNGVGLSASLQLGVSGGTDGIVRVWDLKEGKLKRELPGHQEPIYAVAVAPDGYSAASGGGGDWVRSKLVGKDFDVRLWDLRTLREVRRFPVGSSVKALAFSADGKLLFTGDHDYRVRVWDRESGKEVCRYEGHEGYVFAIAASPDGKHVASGGDGSTVDLWRLPDRSNPEEAKVVKVPLHRFEGHKDQVRCLRFFDGGRRLLSGSHDGSVRYWETYGRREDQPGR